MSTTLVSLEEYLHSEYEPDMDYVDGHLETRNVGEYFHSRLQLLIAAMLHVREKERGFRVFTEQRVRIRERRYRIPDICVKAVPHRVTPILERPDLAIEVVSREDRPNKIAERVLDFIQAGVPVVWVVDPYQHTVSETDASGTRRVPQRVVRTDLVGEIDFNELFARLDEPPE
jgi:Uma2 family endonuclease